METSGWSHAKAEQIWAWIEPFAAYGFNKAHSASYAVVSYQTAYMKANYPGGIYGRGYDRGKRR